MAIAKSANLNYYYIQEQADGSIEATPEFIPLRHKKGGVSITRSTETLEPDEKIQDRHKSPDDQGVASCAGDISVPLAYGAHDDFLEAAFMGTWASDVLKTGKVERTFSILEHHADLDVWYRYNGIVFDSVEFDIPLKNYGQLKFGVQGKDHQAYTLPAGVTYAAVNTAPLIKTTTGSLNVGGSSFGLATNVKARIANGYEATYALHSLEAVEHAYDVINADGELAAYFDSPALYARYLNDTDTVLLETLTDGTNSYVLKVPQASWTDGEKSPAEKNVVTNMKFSAGYESGDQSELMLTR